MKRIAFVLATACVIVLASTGMAFANFGPHGAYTLDTDACASCHRAHTSYSTLGWTDLQGAQRASALLISDANNMTQFCYACHGDSAPGASTNVQSGVFDAGPSSGVGTAPGGSPAHFYTTNSAYDATLNGGGFSTMGGAGHTVMSSHNMDGTGNGQTALIRWGNAGTAGLTPMASFTCTDCHDPHGSSNYRLLKDTVNGVAVGGYTTAGTPDAYVLSNEQGFPTGGFKKGDAGVADAASYVPNYTSAEYAKNSGRAMSAWCSACHTAYSNPSSVYDYSTFLDTGLTGSITYHRHKVDVALEVGTASAANRALSVPLVNDPGLPLEMGIGQLKSGSNYQSAVTWDDRGNVSCLTCHRAHGSDATMTGWAVATLTGGKAQMLTPGSPLGGATVNASNPFGVAPNYSAALLRYDNRGVCERCHNK